MKNGGVKLRHRDEANQIEKIAKAKGPAMSMSGTRREYLMSCRYLHNATGKTALAPSSQSHSRRTTFVDLCVVSL